MEFPKLIVRAMIELTKLPTTCWAQWTASSPLEIIDDLEWPYAFEGHTLTRETAGLRCIECHKGASDIAGRPRW
eukprot:6091143-Amphidinium_carterae.1